MSGTKLSQRQLVLIRRAAEDAIHACNRHYGPFVDVVAHPLNIISLVDMAQESLHQQELIKQKDTVIKFANCMANLDQQKFKELQERINLALQQIQGNLQYVEQDKRENFEFLQMAMIRAFKELEKVLNGGEPK
ncbi:hypothetical protein ACR2E5_05605 [Acinetobacter baumannii]|nr:hypothetical protein [Acinetobacter baumannii]